MKKLGLIPFLILGVVVAQMLKRTPTQTGPRPIEASCRGR